MHEATKFILTGLCVLAMLGISGCTRHVEAPRITGQTTSEEEEPAYSFEEGKPVQITITMEDGGMMKLELNHDKAPKTVENFVKLAKEGFYNGLTFHRIVSGFMIQGGDPEGTGFGGSKETIPGEFAQNGFPQNDISHKRGVISMARSQKPNSASSQFFIVHEDATFLDGQYAAFGMLTEGFDVLDALANTPVRGETPLAKPVIQSITVE